MSAAQLQNIQSFVSTLSDVIDYQRHVRPDPERVTTGDHANIVITTPHNVYHLSVANAYIEPPPGAPIECRALGTVMFRHESEGHKIVGPKSERTFSEISQYVHRTELTKALDAAKQRVAGVKVGDEREATAANTVLAEVVAKAQKWKVGAAPATQAPAVDVRKTVEEDEGPGPHPWVGCPVIYITNPGEHMGGQREVPGVCVRVGRAGRISMFMTPDNSEPSYRDNLVRRGSDAGNGNQHLANCWDFNPHYLREQRRLAHLEEAIGRQADESNQDRGLLDTYLTDFKSLADRVAAIEAKAAQPDRTDRPRK